jgi:hypothetical protein
MLEIPVVLEYKNHEERGDIIARVQDALGHLPSSIALALWAVWGSRGIGKTTLLQILQTRLRADTSVNVLGLWDLDQVDAYRFGKHLFDLLTQNADSRKKVVLLDNIDALLRDNEGAAFFDFEHDVIRVLLERNDTLIITTSRSQLRQWREPEVTARLAAYQLRALSVDQIHQVANEINFSAEQIYATTLGHPQAIRWLRDNPDLSASEIAQKAQTYFFAGLSEAANEFAQLCSSTFIFDIAVLRKILAQTQNDNGAGSYAAFLEHIRELMRVGLVFWDVESGFYRFADNAVRQLCARAFQHQDPARFLAIHSIAATHYQTEAQRVTFLHSSFPSAIYHLASAVSSTAEARTRCLQWVRENISNWIGADWDKVLEWWETGVGDPTIVQEIQQLIGMETFTQVSQLLKDAREGVLR